MISLTSPAARVISLVLTFSLVSAITPYGAWAHGPSQPEAPKKKAQPSRILTQAELEKLSGKGQVQNPVFAGQNKYDVVYKGVNLFTGNFSTGATDLSFEGGYGIPVNVTRCYNSNNPDEGPLGYGWELSVDVRSTAGGVLKSANAPIRSVPVRFSEGRQTKEPGGANNGLVPVDTVVTTDASGEASVIQRDVDGVISPPVWDTNVIETEYELVSDSSGNLYEVMSSNRITTVDGTVYQYSKHGTYDSGSQAEYTSGIVTLDGADNGLKIPSNVLKIDWVKDRQDNTTTYTYATTNQTTYEKANGNTREDRLTGISMPGGHSITLNWNTSTERVTSVTDGFRTITYGYTNGYLTSVTTPATYSGQADYTSSYSYSSPGLDTGATVRRNVLSSITDPRGLATTIESYAGDHTTPIGTFASVFTKRITAPNGVITEFVYGGTSLGATAYDALVKFGAVDHVAASDYSTQQAIAGTVLNGVQTGLQITALNATFTNYDGNDSWLAVSIDPLRFISATSVDEPDPTTAQLVRYFDPTTLNVARQVTRVFALNASASQRNRTRLLANGPEVAAFGDVGAARGIKDDSLTTITATNTVDSTYNFKGSPVSSKTSEIKGTSSAVTKTTTFSYWGPEKYFQQRATKDEAGRFTLTDYYDRTSTIGKRGNVFRTYASGIDSAHSNSFSSSTTDSSTTRFIDGLYATTSNVHSSEIDYDSKGRATSVKKLHSFDGTNKTYVQTTTTYGADGTPWWGQPVSVTEDSGTGSGYANRTTETLSYDPAGRATLVKDALNRYFETTYDLNGRVLSVVSKELVGGNFELRETLSSTEYGTSGISKGMPTSVYSSDGEDESVVSYTYSDSAGGSKGQVYSYEFRGNNFPGNYIFYAYNDAGERSQAKFGGEKSPEYAIQYDDYLPVGDPLSGSRAFQTMTYCTINGSTITPTSEEFHYAYDTAGRVVGAAFAQTPSGTSAPYYFNSSAEVLPATKRAIALSEFDGGGRMTVHRNGWQTYDSNGYSTTSIFENEYGYDGATGLKTSSHFIPGTGLPSGNPWGNHSESYTYHSNLDYLKSVTYNDGLSGGSAEWSYDAAGNRHNGSSLGTTWEFDKLNRMTKSSGVTYAHDIVGNRTGSTHGTGMTQTTRTYSWTDGNQLKGISFGGWLEQASISYDYRADGLRWQKVVDPTWIQEDNSSYWDEELAVNKPTTMTFYDGQMPVEDWHSEYKGGYYLSLDYTQYFNGARGVDCIRKVSKLDDDNWSGATWSYGFPLYDGHGNMIATLARHSTNGYSLGNCVTYDVWGGIRHGSTTESNRYCANLGHKQDPETGLIYMRARYYEPGTGRFISEDPAMDGWNWYAYCGNEPINRGDPSGCVVIEFGGYWIRWDSAYSQEGTGNLIRDLTWGEKRGGQFVQRGSLRPDGTLKHGEAMPNSLQKLLKADAAFVKKAIKNGGNYGVLCIAVLTCSLDVAFLRSMKDMCEIFDILGGEWQLFSGNVVVHGS